MLPHVTREHWSQQRASGPRISKAGPCALTQAAPPRKAALASTTTIRSSCPEIVLRSLILLIAVKNLLTRVALVAKADSGSLDEYIQAFDRRIQSVVDAHALLSQNRWDGVDLAELVRRQLAPNATDAKTRRRRPGTPDAPTLAESVVANTRSRFVSYPG